MTAGLQVFNSNGIVQIDETYRNLAFVQKYTFATAGDHSITTATGRIAPVLALYSAQATPIPTSGLMVEQSTKNADGSWTYRLNGIGEAFLFDVPPAPSLHGQGLQVYTTSGAIAFDSGVVPMKVRDARLFNGPGALGFDYYQFPTQTLSATPGWGGWDIVETSAFEGVVVAAYAKTAAQKWAWINNGNFSPVCFINTPAAGGPSSSPYGAGDGNIHKGLGAIHASGNNFVVNFRDILYDGTYWNGNADWSVFLTFVDVTGL